jgi:hypothetical protein
MQQEQCNEQHIWPLFYGDALARFHLYKKFRFIQIRIPTVKDFYLRVWVAYSREFFGHLTETGRFIGLAMEYVVGV